MGGRTDQHEARVPLEDVADHGGVLERAVVNPAPVGGYRCRTHPGADRAARAAV